MSFESILDLKFSSMKGAPRPDFYTDLNLKQIMDRINTSWGDDVTKLYYFPADKDCEEYRRAVYADVKKPEVNKLLLEFLDRFKERRKALEKKSLVRPAGQKAVWHVREVAAYVEAYCKLYEDLRAVELTGQGMLDLRKELKQYTESEEFKAMKASMEQIMEELFRIRLIITYENGQVFVSEGETERSYEQFLTQSFTENKDALASPFGGSNELTPLEQEVMKIYTKKNPAFFKAVDGFYSKYENYAKQNLLQFAEEICYYLSFCKFANQMQEHGFAFAAPETCERKDFSAEGLYDLALAVVNSRAGKPVISNDFDYRENEQFFVLTGPNQGGKTTFARSLGQLIYFGKLGFDVPAKAAKLPYFAHILTHFSVEESLETGRGKLKEELIRLAPMMDSVYENTFVIINELFTTAANYDACIMGKNVLEHFIGQNCMGIYVTHLRELTEAHPAVVSLRATLDENKVQSFIIMRSAADESACAINQVNKYQLSYEQLKARLS